MPSPFFLINSAIPIGQVKLGSLVPDVVRPHIDALAPVAVKDDDVLISEQLNFQALIERGKNSAFEACLTQLASGSREGSTTHSTELSSYKAMCYEIRNPLSFFKEVAAQNSARLWLQDAIAGGRKTYVITGLRTLFDGEIKQNQSSSNSSGGGVQIPLGAILAGGLDPTLGLVDVGLKGELGKTAKQQQVYLAPEEQIYAVQYRKIAFKWFSSKSVDAAFLDAKNRWKILGEEVRGPEEDDDDEEDIVEADIEDILALHDKVEETMVAVADDQEQYLRVPEGTEI
jgi:hypothetical protein